MNSRKIFSKLALLASFFVFTPLVHAAPGQLDTAFGTGGKLVWNNGGGNALIGNAAIYQPATSAHGARILVAGSINVSGGSTGKDFFLAAFKAEGPGAGTLDNTTFGDSSDGPTGYISTNFSGLDDEAASIALLPNGNIVIAGYATESTSPSTTIKKFAVAAYDQNGRALSGWGTAGSGRTAPHPGLSATAAEATSILALADNSILVAGTITTPSGKNVRVMKFNSTGFADSTFGVGGIQTVSAVDAEAKAIAVAGEKIYVGGTGASNTMVVFRFNLDGSLAAGTSNWLGAHTAVPFAHPSTLTFMGVKDGKIILGGVAIVATPPTGETNVARLNEDGSLDTSFGTGGKTTYSTWTSTPSIFAATAGIVQPSDGKIIAGGESVTFGGANQVGVGRFLANGSAIDSGFGTAGKTIIGEIVGGSTTSQGTINGIALDPQGNIYAVGNAAAAATSITQLLILKYQGDPAAVGAVCGNHTCDTGESVSSCPADCSTTVRCGDGVCSTGETNASCAADCRAGAGSPPPADSGSSSCSFNPQAIFSFSQLALLAIFPAFVGLRLRRKK